jgi:hypothetical protein
MLNNSNIPLELDSGHATKRQRLESLNGAHGHGGPAAAAASGGAIAPPPPPHARELDPYYPRQHAHAKENEQQQQQQQQQQHVPLPPKSAQTAAAAAPGTDEPWPPPLALSEWGLPPEVRGRMACVCVVLCICMLAMLCMFLLCWRPLMHGGGQTHTNKQKGGRGLRGQGRAAAVPVAGGGGLAGRARQQPRLLRANQRRVFLVFLRLFELCVFALTKLATYKNPPLPFHILVIISLFTIQNTKAASRSWPRC